MKRTAFLFCLLFSLFCEAQLSAQDLIYTDARNLTLIGKHTPTDMYYHRVDTLRYNTMPRAVKLLYTNSSGMAIAFKTNSNTIAAKWLLGNSPRIASNMTSIAHSGLDLYIRRGGQWVYAGSGKPIDLLSTSILIENMEDGEKECLLYLPLYNELKELEIGIEKGCDIVSLANPFGWKVVVYGSSITQGASASRAGMAYTSQISRRSGIHFINLGVSGSGKMEPEVANMLAEIDADAFILDCAANPSPQLITERTAYLVNRIREKHLSAPIIMIESVVREKGTFDTMVRKRVADQNKNFEEEYTKLIASGVKNLYLIQSVDLLGTDHEGSVDGVHPNDLGFSRFLQAVEPQLLEILKHTLTNKVH